MRRQHEHTEQCPAHVEDCSCPDLENYLCNPYWTAGFCPEGILVLPLTGQ